MAPEAARAVIVTVSDSCARGEREDLSGPRARDLLRSQGFTCDEVRVVPDEREAIAALLRELGVRGGVRLVVTTGGTGLAPRDVTPEATRAVIDREVPGIAELLRAEGARRNPRAVLTRGVAGLSGGVLIVNLPGSVKGVTEGLAALAAVLPHALEVAGGEAFRCGG